MAPAPSVITPALRQSNLVILRRRQSRYEFPIKFNILAFSQSQAHLRLLPSLYTTYSLISTMSVDLPSQYSQYSSSFTTLTSSRDSISNLKRVLQAPTHSLRPARYSLLACLY